MKRRAFIGSAAGAAALSAVNGSPDAAPSAPRAGGKSLAELRDEHRRWLFDDFIPFFDRYVIDHERGGFQCTVDRDGTRIDDGKRGWYEGRGIWVYSHLYNHFAREQKYLDVAEKSVNFIMKHQPSGDNLWPENYTADGNTSGAPDTRTYGHLFIALGLQEFARATGDRKWWDLAKNAVLTSVRHFDNPEYEPGAVRSYLGQSAPLLPGARVQGVWMCYINTLTGMLEQRRDAELEGVMDRSLDAVLNFHFNPEFGLNNEIVNHDLSRPPAPVDQLVYTGHAIETLWMIMYEAVRRKDKQRFDLAAERFRRHVEVAWDDVYGGVFAGLLNVNEYRWETNKVLWAQEEVLIGALCAWEHTGAKWALEWYDRMYGYVMDKYPLKKHGFALWMNQGDRRVTFTPHYNRAENFHHPRHLMLNILALERIIKRKGRVSGVFG